MKKRLKEFSRKSNFTILQNMEVGSISLKSKLIKLR